MTDRIPPIDTRVQAYRIVADDLEREYSDQLVLTKAPAGLREIADRYEAAGKQRSLDIRIGAAFTRADGADPTLLTNDYLATIGRRCRDVVDLATKP